jgi:hypothetical protein
MNSDKIEDVLSEDLGEGYRIVRDNGELSPVIKWVDLVQQSDNEKNILVEVHFEDETDEVFEKGVKLKKIWHENAIINSNEDVVLSRVYYLTTFVLFVGACVYLGKSMSGGTEAFLLGMLPILALLIASVVFVVIDLRRKS